MINLTGCVHQNDKDDFNNVDEDDDDDERWCLLGGGADKSLARPNSPCRRTESIVSLKRGVYSYAELQVSSCYRG